MQTGRQKKKFSQQKKRHHDHIKAKGGAAGPPTSQSKETSKKEKAVSEKSQDRNTIAKEQNVKKTFPKANPLGSNWDRYEELDLEGTESEASRRADEELFEQRLVQLLNLPIQHVAAPPTPDRTSGSLDPFSGGEDVVSSFLNIDCAALAKSLSALPMHQRLGLDRDFVELCELDALPGDADSSLPINTPQSVDLSMCSTRKKKYTYAFNIPGKPVSETTTAENTSIPRTISETSDQISSFEGETIHSGFERKSALASVPTKAVSASEGDEELEKLLQTAAKVTVGQEGPRERLKEDIGAADATPPSSSQTQKLPASGAKVARSVLASSPGAAPVQKPGDKEGSVQDMDTEELDDMLDELLS